MLIHYQLIKIHLIMKKEKTNINIIKTKEIIENYFLNEKNKIKILNKEEY
jgi:hypothetical protein